MTVQTPAQQTWVDLHKVIADELYDYGLGEANVKRLAGRVLDAIDGASVPPRTLSQWSTKRLRLAYMVQRYKRGHLRHERDAVVEALRLLVAAIDHEPSAVHARVVKARRVLSTVPGGVS